MDVNKKKETLFQKIINWLDKTKAILLALGAVLAVAIPFCKNYYCYIPFVGCPPSIIYFNSNNTTIREGDIIKLSWKVEYAEEVEIEGIGLVKQEGESILIVKKNMEKVTLKARRGNKIGTDSITFINIGAPFLSNNCFEKYKYLCGYYTYRTKLDHKILEGGFVIAYDTLSQKYSIIGHRNKVNNKDADILQWNSQWVNICDDNIVFKYSFKDSSYSPIEGIAEMKYNGTSILDGNVIQVLPKPPMYGTLQMTKGESLDRNNHSW